MPRHPTTVPPPLLLLLLLLLLPLLLLLFLISPSAEFNLFKEYPFRVMLQEGTTLRFFSAHLLPPSPLSIRSISEDKFERDAHFSLLFLEGGGRAGRSCWFRVQSVMIAVFNTFRGTGLTERLFEATESEPMEQLTPVLNMKCSRVIQEPLIGKPHNYSLSKLL
uniref:N-acetyltransferase domain-containing protein n=1 Tax=Caenorhabditis tropicalis TaxID=1561998 RepID=A0A1I7UYK4_9PELO